MRVVVADGHPFARLGLKTLLLATDVQIVGESEDGEKALRLVKEARPDLVILGCDLTGKVDGPEVCRRIKTLPDPPRVLVHAAHDPAGESASFLAGADGYVHKRTCPQQFLYVMRRIAAGEQVWLPGSLAVEPPSRTHCNLEEADLTPMEQKVLAFILGPATNAEIAEELRLSASTVKTHVRNVLRKLGFESRRELIRSGVLGRGVPFGGSPKVFS